MILRPTGIKHNRLTKRSQLLQQRDPAFTKSGWTLDPKRWYYLHMLAKVWSAAIVGLDAVSVEVEVDIASQGLPNFFIVGLPDKAVDEAKERVRTAIRNSGGE